MAKLPEKEIIKSKDGSTVTIINHKKGTLKSTTVTKIKKTDEG
jgi:hypothetical protein